MSEAKGRGPSGDDQLVRLGGGERKAAADLVKTDAAVKPRPQFGRAKKRPRITVLRDDDEDDVRYMRQYKINWSP